MLEDIVEVRPLEGCQLHLRFEDGTEGTVDLSRHVRFDGVFEPLREREYFSGSESIKNPAPFVGRMERIWTRMCCIHKLRANRWNCSLKRSCESASSLTDCRTAA